MQTFKVPFYISIGIILLVYQWFKQTKNEKFTYDSSFQNKASREFVEILYHTHMNELPIFDVWIDWSAVKKVH